MNASVSGERCERLATTTGRGRPAAHADRRARRHGAPRPPRTCRRRPGHPSRGRRAPGRRRRPTTGAPPRTSAMLTVKSVRRLMNSRVPSSGSTRMKASPASSPTRAGREFFLGDAGHARKRRAQAGENDRLGLPVRFRHGSLVALRLDRHRRIEDGHDLAPCLQRQFAKQRRTAPGRPSPRNHAIGHRTSLAGGRTDLGSKGSRRRRPRRRARPAPISSRRGLQACRHRRHRRPRPMMR